MLKIILSEMASMVSLFQEDTVYETATPNEALAFSAKLRCNVSDEECQKRVETPVQQLGIKRPDKSLGTATGTPF